TWARTTSSATRTCTAVVESLRRHGAGRFDELRKHRVDLGVGDFLAFLDSCGLLEEGHDHRHAVDFRLQVQPRRLRQERGPALAYTLPIPGRGLPVVVGRGEVGVAAADVVVEAEFARDSRLAAVRVAPDLGVELLVGPAGWNDGMAVDHFQRVVVA